jgi:hypothetical protein
MWWKARSGKHHFISCCCGVRSAWAHCTKRPASFISIPRAPPVIATRLGGMIELIEDGRTGWLAPDAGVSGMVDGLATALRRCLAISPEETIAMGHTAAQSVRRICDNEAILSAHLTFRADLVRRGAQRSLLFALSARVKSPPEGEPPWALSSGRGAAIVVRVEALVDAEPVLRCIYAQTTPPRAVALVSADRLADAKGSLAQQLVDCGTVVLFRPDLRGTDAWDLSHLVHPQTGGSLRESHG